MLDDFDMGSLIDHTVRLYSHDEMIAIVNKEERACFCFDDARHCARFADDPVVEWQAFVFLRDVRWGLGRFGVKARASRACGMVQFWGSDFITHPDSENFWPYLWRRAEKQCGSLDQSAWRMAPLKLKGEGQERKRHKHTWRQRNKRSNV